MTYIVYPWYRAKPPSGANLIDYPRSYLLANPNLAVWHNFGMEWKEHIAWFAPILATVVAFIVLRYGIKMMYLADLLLFGIGSLRGGLAPSFGS